MPMWLIVMKGFAGSGKSTLARALVSLLDQATHLQIGESARNAPCARYWRCNALAQIGFTGGL